MKTNELIETGILLGMLPDKHPLVWEVSKYTKKLRKEYSKLHEAQDDIVKAHCVVESENPMTGKIYALKEGKERDTSTSIRDYEVIEGLEESFDKAVSELDLMVFEDIAGPKIDVEKTLVKGQPLSEIMWEYYTPTHIGILEKLNIITSDEN